MNHVARLNRVTKNIDGFQLGPIDLEFESGFVTALVGSNGAGKSTLLKILMNLVKQNDGSVTLFGQQVDGNSEDWKAKVAYMPQTYPGPLPFTGSELKKLTARWYPNWDEPLFQKMVEQFQIPLEKKFEKLSQGVQQKLKFALTLARNPQLLILDEPTSHVDIPAKKLMIDLLIDWLEQGERTILLATHQVEDIRKLADYIVIMDDGDNLGKHEKDELMSQYKRYWIEGNLPTATVPGEIERRNGVLVTKCPAQTEEFLQKRGITWSASATLELDEIISIMLANKKITAH